MNMDEKVKLINEKIVTDVFDDRSVSQDETYSALQSIVEECKVMQETLEVEE